MPDASGPVIYEQKLNIENITYSELFWKVWDELGYILPEDLENCYIFEMMTSHNQNIVHQDENKIVLHGVRNIHTLEEKDPKIYSKKYGWELVKIHHFDQFDEMIKFSKY
jgi:hypothetical protein